MWFKKLWIVLSLCVLGLAITAGPCYDNPVSVGPPSFETLIAQEQPVWTPDGLMIMFAYGPDLYSVTSDGGILTLIVSEEHRILSPDISPDGSTVAYTSVKKESGRSSGEHWEVKTVNMDGSSQRTLSRNDTEGNNRPNDINPSWSPDGKRIAFVSNCSGEEDVYHIYTIAADGSDLQRLVTSVPAGLPAPNWSPDGQRLAFRARGEDFPTTGEEYAYVAEVNSGGLTNLGQTWSTPTWSPDGSRLAFIGTDGNKRVVVSATPDRSVSRNITEVNQNRDDSAPFEYLSWSPDGKKLFLSTHSGVASDYSTYIIDLAQPNPSGEGFKTTWFGGSLPSWSPDNSKIATYHSRGFGFFTVSPDGSDRRLLVTRGEDGLMSGSQWETLEREKNQGK